MNFCCQPFSRRSAKEEEGEDLRTFSYLPKEGQKRGKLIFPEGSGIFLSFWVRGIGFCLFLPDKKGSYVRHHDTSGKGGVGKRKEVYGFLDASKKKTKTG